jgi:hypothetical protein
LDSGGAGPGLRAPTPLTELVSSWRGSWVRLRELGQTPLVVLLAKVDGPKVVPGPFEGQDMSRLGLRGSGHPVPRWLARTVRISAGPERAAP